MKIPWKMPPLIKIYEALGALAGGRVEIIDEERAIVTSSDGQKTYEVVVTGGGHEVSSNDNASYWQGYIGYPAVAVLLRRGLLPTPSDVPSVLGGVVWKEINQRFKGDYSKTLGEVDRILNESGHEPSRVRSEASAVLEALQALAPVRGKRARPAKHAASGD